MMVVTDKAIERDNPRESRTKECDTVSTPPRLEKVREEGRVEEEVSDLN